MEGTDRQGHHCTALNIELVVNFSLIISAACFAEGVFRMAQLNFANWTSFESSYKKSSVDLIFSADVALLIILPNLLLRLFQCMF